MHELLRVVKDGMDIHRYLMNDISIVSFPPDSEYRKCIMYITLASNSKIKGSQREQIIVSYTVNVHVGSNMGPSSFLLKRQLIVEESDPFESGRPSLCFK